MSSWDNVYPERINWKNNQAPPIDDVNLNKVDAALRKIDDRVVYLGGSETFVLPASDWVVSNNGIYKAIQHISTNKYSADDNPVGIVTGLKVDETAEEHISIDLVGKAVVDGTGITVYATEVPSSDLKLIIKR